MSNPPPPLESQSLTLEQILKVAKLRHHAGKVSEAETIYRQILQIQPNQPDALHLLGAIALNTGNAERAIKLIRQAIEQDPAAAYFHYNLGRALTSVGKLGEALKAFQAAIELRPNFPEAHFHLGMTLQADQRLNQAITAYRQAVELRPNFAEAQNNLGNALAERGQYKAALGALQQAAEFLPEHSVVQLNLGKVYFALGNVDEAIACFEKSLRLNPIGIEAHNNLGEALRLAGRFEDACRACKKAILENPASAMAHINLGLALQSLRDFEGAAKSFYQAIKLSPDNAVAHCRLGELHLLLGDFPKGWPEFDWRWNLPQLAIVHADAVAPLWDGSDLSGKRILLHGQQCSSDTIQFVRYIPLLAKQGAYVIVQCHSDLRELLRSVQGVEQIIEYGNAIPKVDFQCQLMRLPVVLQTTLRTIPSAVPYLSVSHELSERWLKRLKALGSGPKVGLCRAGRITDAAHQGQAIPWSELEPLLGITGVHFIVLQNGGSDPDPKPQVGTKLTAWSDELSDFADTAAVIMNLDMIIAVDSPIAHLAGALARPVLVPLQYMPNWRWMIDRVSSPWYRTMRLVRQQSPGNWADPIHLLARRLRRRMATKNAQADEASNTTSHGIRANVDSDLEAGGIFF